ncbi:MAG: winged helix-turn-helix domain-containing protein [Tepidiformaceae bacterium]
MDSLTLAEARRLALAAQGLALPRPAVVTEAELERVVQHVDLVQLDSVNVLVRSHYLPFFSRLGPYDRGLLDSLVYERRALFEHWGHMASLIPIERYGMMRHRMEELRSRPHWHLELINEEFPGYFETVLEEVRSRGPISVSGLEDGGERRGWWGYGRGKMALEWHFASGAIAASGRRNFMRSYDLAERVFAADVLAQPALSKEEAQREMLLIGARCHGVGTARDLADYYRLRMPDARPHLRGLVDAGQLELVAVEGWPERAYMLPGTPNPPTAVTARALLSPFDSLVWERARTERLFGFHYRIEIYTPEPQRRFGYYVLPFLMDEQLVARIDLKADRKLSALEVRGAHAEEGVQPAAVAAALAPELVSMAEWLGLEQVRIGNRGSLAAPLLKIPSFRPIS